ncbi:aminoacyl-tRNA hydrolase [Aestuariimicrobium ganziense]|uniref:aminoacyl-tRNA hydrolase n=1 Tax=Aestuariimicrobium ganziense TaxID=2773677 RepID=UPI001944496A|nr:aminoacyl-tRNA hydrolase [Aestuariimicrobium ganziense]
MTWLLVGLGNPGPTYAMTRHNVGFFVADELARRAGSSFTAPRGMHAEVSVTRISSAGLGAVGADATKLVVAKPRTFMNDSGRAVRKLCDFHQIPPERVVAVHDELDIDFETLRVKFGGGDNGHNGLKSIRAHLGTGDYYRVRYGIGRPPGRQDPAAYVLQPIPSSLREAYAVQTTHVADAVESLLTQGLERTQNLFNS